MAIVPSNNQDALLSEVNGLLDSDNFKDSSLNSDLFDSSVLEYIENILKEHIVCGIIEANGSIASGSGFTVVNSSTGVYKITLSKELNTIGSITGNLEGTGTGGLSVEGKSKKEFTVRTFSAATNALANIKFNFQIITT